MTKIVWWSQILIVIFLEMCLIFNLNKRKSLEKIYIMLRSKYVEKYKRFFQLNTRSRGGMHCTMNSNFKQMCESILCEIKL